MKKAVSLFLVLTLAATALMGCGNTTNNTTSEGGSSDTTQSEEASEGTDASGSTGGEVFKIGGIGPTTGGAAIYGQAVKNGAQLAVDEINEAGGIGGYQVEFTFEDDEHDATKSVNAYNTLKDSGIQMLLGTTTSTPCIAVADKTAADNMFQLTPSGSAVECVANDNAFRVCFSDPDQGTASAKYIGENGLATKIAVIYDSSDVYSSGIYEKFASEAANQPFEIVSAEAFTADSKTDFTVQVQKAKEAGADMIFLPIYYTEASLILAQADKIGYDVKFFGCDGLDGLLTVEDFNTELAEGVMLLTPFAADATDELTTKFVAAYKSAYTDTPNQFAADAYDGIYAMKEAAEKAAIKPDMSVSDICDAMKTAMTEISLNGLTGENITWSAAGEPTKAPKAVEIKNGAYSAM